MSYEILTQSNSISAPGPIVVTCTAPVAAPVPIPIPIASQASVSVMSLPVPTLPVPVRPAFNWRNTTDRLREGLHRPLPFENIKVRRHRQSAFLEMGLQGELIKEEPEDLEVAVEDEIDDQLEREDMDEILPRSRQTRQARQAWPVSGIFLTNFLRLGLEDAENTSPSVNKRLSWSPAGATTPTDILSPVSTNSLSGSRSWSTVTSMTSVTTPASSLSDRKRPWYAKLRGDGSSKGSTRLVRNRSLQPIGRDLTS
ncbi:hypothetical protein SEUCBS139899_008348 [Sporothrix eucalyptigena]